MTAVFLYFRFFELLLVTSNTVCKPINTHMYLYAYLYFSGWEDLVPSGIFTVCNSTGGGQWNVNTGPVL